MTRSVLQSRGNAEVGMAVTLLTGVDRLSMDAVAFSLVDSCPSVCSITYDVRRDDDAESGLDVVWRMDEPMEGGAMFGTSDSFALQDCCLSCEVKHHAVRLLESVAGWVDSVLISLPIGVEATPVAQYLDDLFRLDDWGEGSRVAAIADAVGLDEFEERFFDDDLLCLCGVGADDSLFDERSTGAVVSRLIREASHVLELPVVGSGCLARHVDALDECACRDIIRAIAKRGAVVHEDAHDVSLQSLCSRDYAVSLL